MVPVRGLALQNSEYRAMPAPTAPAEEPGDDWDLLGFVLRCFTHAHALTWAFDKVFGLPQSAM